MKPEKEKSVMMTTIRMTILLVLGLPLAVPTVSFWSGLPWLSDKKGILHLQLSCDNTTGLLIAFAGIRLMLVYSYRPLRMERCDYGNPLQ
jgi:hypothetical protein